MTLISREDAIERIANDNVVGGMKRINEYRGSTEHNDYLDGISTAIATVDDLPSAEAKWIPCSERLPSEDGCYLVCMAWDYCAMRVLKWADGWNCHRSYDVKVKRENEIDGVDIIAWMPLPKPYREDGE